MIRRHGSQIAFCKGERNVTMLNLAKILLPVDFSERSLAAGRYAGMLACRCQSEVTMLHVVPYQYPIGGFEAPIDPPDWRSQLVDEARKRLDSFMTDEFARMAVKRVLLEGDPAVRITEFAQSEGVNLIVMSTHGYGPFRRFILGSEAAKVLHDADCAVLTSAHIQDAPPPESMAFRNVLCAVDFGPQSRAALDWAVQFAEKFDSRLHVVHVMPPLAQGPTRYFDQDLIADFDRSAKETVYQLLEGIGDRTEVLIRHGEVAKVVRTAAESTKADLVVIGRHSSSGVLGRLHADAYSIVRESPCPVVSV
jgi:nucleotide-binding universal stress UspA family protein